MTLPVQKTYKLYVGGKFPRSESGRSYQPVTAPHCNVARASRKDLRDAVVAARAALPGWSGSTAYLRGQILYRLAEMLQTHQDALVSELVQGGSKKTDGRKEVEASIALCVWYAGLGDKLQSLLGGQNDVQGPFFAFSTIEPCGVVGVVAPEQPSLLGLLALLLPVVCSGNTAVALGSEAAPFAALALGERLQVSDFPAGVVNLLSGHRQELLGQFASHRDLDGLLLCGAPDAEVGRAAAQSVTRVRWAPIDAFAAPERLGSLLWVEPFVEVKTLWHPVAP